MPGVKKHIFHPRQTDDLFVVALEINDQTSEQEAIDFLKSTGTVETSIQIAESEWWYGRFDKEEEYEKIKPCGLKEYLIKSFLNKEFEIVYEKDQKHSSLQ